MNYVVQRQSWWFVELPRNDLEDVGSSPLKRRRKGTFMDITILIEEKEGITLFDEFYYRHIGKVAHIKEKWNPKIRVMGNTRPYDKGLESTINVSACSRFSKSLHQLRMHLRHELRKKHRNIGWLALQGWCSDVKEFTHAGIAVNDGAFLLGLARYDADHLWEVPILNFLAHITAALLFIFH